MIGELSNLRVLLYFLMEEVRDSMERVETEQRQSMGRERRKYGENMEKERALVDDGRGEKERERQKTFNIIFQTASFSNIKKFKTGLVKKTMSL